MVPLSSLVCGTLVRGQGDTVYGVPGEQVLETPAESSSPTHAASTPEASTELGER